MGCACEHACGRLCPLLSCRCCGHRLSIAPRSLPAFAPNLPCLTALNVAWAWHEIVADYVRPTLMWLEKRGQDNLAALVSSLGYAVPLGWC